MAGQAAWPHKQAPTVPRQAAWPDKQAPMPQQPSLLPWQAMMPQAGGCLALGALPLQAAGPGEQAAA